MTPHRLRALVVDDSRTVAALLKHFLQQDGFEVEVAPDGIGGLEAARRESPDVIVTDANMPGMDGNELVRALRMDGRTCRATIVMLTSDDSPASAAEASRCGVDAYLVKPVPPQGLAARIHAVMTQRERLAS